MLLGGLTVFRLRFPQRGNSGLHHRSLLCRSVQRKLCLPTGGNFTLREMSGPFESWGFGVFIVGVFLFLFFHLRVNCISFTAREKLTFHWRAVHNHPAGLRLYWVLPPHQRFSEAFRENEETHPLKHKDAERNFSFAIRKKSHFCFHRQELSLGTSRRGRKD